MKLDEPRECRTPLENRTETGTEGGGGGGVLIIVNGRSRMTVPPRITIRRIAHTHTRTYVEAAFFPTNGAKGANAERATLHMRMSIMGRRYRR